MFNAETDNRAQVDADILAIAKKHFRIETLETRKSDQLDFHDCAVWSIKRALLDAYALGISESIQNRVVLK
jgi:hypothetical protein